ncbi:MAG: hypothetical protein ACREAC_28180, partial [Blastocatellia bacterium]
MVISDPAAGTAWAVDHQNQTMLVLHGQPKAPRELKRGAQPPGMDDLPDYEGLKYLSDNRKSE